MNGLRSNLVIVFVVLISAAVISRLFYLQVSSSQYWRALAQGQQNKFEEVLTERGEIFLGQNSLPLALNRDTAFAFISPTEVKDQEGMVKVLSETLGLEKNYILGKLENKESLFELLKENLSDQEVEKLKEENMDGVYLGKARQRYYPQETLASNVLGFVNKDGSGQYGLEGYYNDLLSGQNGILQNEKGQDITLTIDYNIQFMSEKVLKDAVEKLGSESGQIIVADPNSGKIIALADYPDFNPNNYTDYSKEGNLEIFKNAATQKLFEPGSVLKPITMAVGLEEGKITPQTVYQDPGSIKIGGRTISNYAQRTYPGDITMTGVLEKSINTGAVFVEQMLAHDVFLNYLENFGFFEKSGIDTQEVFSENDELKKGRDLNLATASFGQGIEMTPIQLVRAFCAIANGGKLPLLYLVDKKNENGKIVQTQPEFSDQIISKNTASQVTAMMVSVVKNGYGKAAQVPGYYIAGKTGTAQVPEGGGYSSEKTIQSFLGFAPAFDPKFLILVKLDNPKAKTAEYSAVPAFHDLASYIINLWKIAPDYNF